MVKAMANLSAARVRGHNDGDIPTMADNVEGGEGDEGRGE